MDYATWSPVYRELLADFGFDAASDERARDELADLTVAVDWDRLDATGRTVAVAGAGPSLVDPDHPDREGELDRAREADAVFAASTAAAALRDADVAVDCLVTDLDGCPETARELTLAGTPVAVHAHGDNVPAVREWVPRLDADHVLATTQARPVAHVHNPGGFTDGDRAAFLADHLDAAQLRFVGWDLDDPEVGPVKAKKLGWAERLLRWLERRRGERFAILDGRRDRLDVDGFPLGDG